MNLFLPFSIRSQQDALRAQDRLRGNLDLASSERAQLERVRQQLNEQIDEMTSENQKLQAANTELQRQRDSLEDEKEDVSKDKERQVKENERWSVKCLLVEFLTEWLSCTSWIILRKLKDIVPVIIA